MKRKILLIVMCFLFLGIGGYFGVQWYREWNEYRIGEQQYERLTQYVHLEATPTETPMRPKKEPEETAPPVTEPTEAPVGTVPPETEPGILNETEPPPTEPEPTEPPDDTVWPEVDFDALCEINPEVVAWIYIEGTNINYPVVQGSDNSYYLNHLYDGTYNSAGTIFMDYRNRQDLSGRNTVFYGHHMQNGTMFQQITKYKEQSFYEEHPVCLIMTPNGNYKVEFFAGYVIDMNSQAWKMEFESDEEFGNWLEDAITRSLFAGTAEPAPQDRVVTLSTCTYEYNDARFVLVGILKPQTTY